MDISIRMATPDDIPKLAQMRWNARIEGGESVRSIDRAEFLPRCEQILEKWMDRESHFVWVAENNGTMIAQICLHRVDLFPRPVRIHDQFGIITENYTLPQHRNRGIGSRLMEHLVQWAKDKDYELLIVYPSQRAVPFYERHGFSQDNDVMELRLRDY